MTARSYLTTLAITCLLLAGCGDRTTKAPSSRSASPPEPASAASSTATPVTLPAVTALDAALEITDNDSPDWVLMSHAVAWVATKEGIRRYSPDGTILGTTSVGGPICLAMDEAFEAVWVGVCGPEAAVVRLDPATGAVIARISIAGGLMPEGSLGAGEGAVWAISEDPVRLLRIDPATNVVSASFTLGAGAAGVRAGEGGVWVTLADVGKVAHIDPATGEILEAIAVGNTPRFLTVANRGVWVMNNGDGSVSHIDPATDHVVATVSVDAGPINGGDIAAGGGSV